MPIVFAVAGAEGPSRSAPPTTLPSLLAASHHLLRGFFAGRDLHDVDFFAAAFFVVPAAAAACGGGGADDGGDDAAGSSSSLYVSFRGLGSPALLPLPATDSGDVGGVVVEEDGDVSKNIMPLSPFALFLSLFVGDDQVAVVAVSLVYNITAAGRRGDRPPSSFPPSSAGSGSVVFPGGDQRPPVCPDVSGAGFSPVEVAAAAKRRRNTSSSSGAMRPPPPPVPPPAPPRRTVVVDGAGEVTLAD